MASVEPAARPPYDKEGIYVKDRTMYVVGTRYAAKVSRALASDTRARIIEVLQSGPADLDTIAERVGQSKANVSSQVRILEDVGIVKPIYMPGQRGIKKIIELQVDRIFIYLTVETVQQ